MVPDRRLQGPKGPVVEIGRGYFQVTQRRGAEGVPQRSITLRLLVAKILVLASSVEDHVACADAEHRYELRAADTARLEVAKHLIGLARNRVAGNTSGFAEKKQRTSFLAQRHCTSIAARETIERRIRGSQGCLELGDGAPAHVDRDAAARQRNSAVEYPPELFQILGNGIQSSVDGNLNGEVVESGSIGYRQDLAMAVVKLEMAWAEVAWIGGNSSEPRHLDQLGRRDRGLRCEQGWYVGDQGFGKREFESQRIVKGIAGERDESRRPHQRRVKDCVWDEWCATLVARSAAVWSDDVVVVNTYCHRLRVTKTKCRRMAPGTGVVIMQAEDFVEEQQAPEISHRGIYSATKSCFKRRPAVAREARIVQDLPKIHIQTACMVILCLGIRWVHGHENGNDVEGSEEQQYSQDFPIT